MKCKQKCSINKKKSGEKRVYKALNHLAEANNCKIDEYDVWGTSGIAIDKSSKKVFYVIKDSKNDVVVDLTFVKLCREFETKGKSKLFTEQLALIFDLTNSANGSINIEFYNGQNSNFAVSDEDKLLQKWQQIVNKTIAL